MARLLQRSRVCVAAAAALLIVHACLVQGNSVNLKRIHQQIQSTLAGGSVRSADADLYFTQQLDHFAPPFNNTTFEQRYFVNSSMWTTGGPVFLIIGGEGQESASGVVSGEVVQLAAAEGALLFSLEHRFYGASVPAPELTTDSLIYLTTNQALADIATFRAAMIEQFSVPATTPWMVFGCSYSGALSAWFKASYPLLAAASLSSSSPIEATLSFYQYDEHVSAALPSSSAASIRGATLQVQTLVQENSSAVKEQFGCESVEDDVAFLYVLADTVAFAVQYNSSYATVPRLCDMMGAATGLDAVQAYADYVQWLFNFTSTSARTWDISSFTNTSVAPQDNMRQWMWQSCTELGYFQTAPANNSLRSALITPEWHYAVCAHLFQGVPIGATQMVPKVDFINNLHGGQDIQSSYTIFTNGENDPWKALSLTSTLSDTMPAVLIAGASHCANWAAPRATDPPALTDARALIASYIRIFQSGNITAACPNACNDHGTCGVTVLGDTAVATCTCFDGWTDTGCMLNDESTRTRVLWWVVVVCGVACAVIGAGAGWIIGTRHSRRYSQLV